MIKTLLLGAVKLYKLTLSPWIGEHCRFYPSCSDYYRDAIEARGALRGSFLFMRRLLKCQPFYSGGVDLAPAKGCEKKHRQDLP